MGIKTYPQLLTKLECLSMLTFEMVARPGCNVLLLCALVHLIALQLQRGLVQEPLAYLPVRLKCGLWITVPHPKIGCTKSEVHFLVRHCTTATNELATNEWSSMVCSKLTTPCNKHIIIEMLCCCRMKPYFQFLLSLREQASSELLKFYTILP